MPIRTLVMIPAISSLLLLCLIVWALFLFSRNADLTSGRDDTLLKNDGFKSAEADYNATKQLEAIAKSELEQLESYRGARIVFSDVLQQFPSIVPETMQLTSLDIMPPQRPLQAKDEKPPSGNEQSVEAKKPVPKGIAVAEKVNLKLVGLVDSATSVDGLRTRLQSEPFTQLIVSTEIPKGGFRVSGDRSSSTFIFEVDCECSERIFK